MTERTQSPEEKQKVLIEQAQKEARDIRKTHHPEYDKRAMDVAQLFENLAKEVVQLQNIIDEAKK